MAMNREFLEEMYNNHRLIGERLRTLSPVNTFCAEACKDCGRTINSNEPAHRSVLDEVSNQHAQSVALLDLYWKTHNGEV